jgi:hypothetical protein
MLSQVFESWYRAVEATVEVQQEFLQRWAGVRLAESTRRAPCLEPSAKSAAEGISRVPGFSRAEFEELKKALVEYEIAEGDWSKSR